MKKAQYIIILISVIFAQALIAQDGEYITIRDLESWSSVGLKYKITHHWSLGLEEQLRLKDNSSKVDAYLTELNTNYDFSDRVSGGIGLRYIRDNDTSGDVQGFENHMRLHFDLEYKREIERLSFDTRIRFQTKNELGISSDQGDYANNHLRLKMGLKYNIKKWKLDPEFSSEIFRHYEQGEQKEFDKFRITLQTKYKIKGYGKIGAFYRMEKELNVAYPKTTNIVGLKYTYTFKNSKKQVEKKVEDEEVIWH